MSSRGRKGEGALWGLLYRITHPTQEGSAFSTDPLIRASLAKSISFGAQKFNMWKFAGDTHSDHNFAQGHTNRRARGISCHSPLLAAERKLPRIWRQIKTHKHYLSHHHRDKVRRPALSPPTIPPSAGPQPTVSLVMLSPRTHLLPELLPT